MQRKELANSDEAVTLFGNRRHSPAVFEDLLSNSLADLSIQNNIVCVDCTRFCKHEAAVHIYIELSNSEDVPLTHDDIATLICGNANTFHKEDCAEIIFFQVGTINNYSDTDGHSGRR